MSHSNKPCVGWPVLRLDQHELEQRQALSEAGERNARAQLAMEERAQRARDQKAAREAELRGAVMWGAICWDTAFGEHHRHVYAKTADEARRKMLSFGWEVCSQVSRIGGGQQ